MKEFEHISPSSITISRDARQRKELEKIDELADSIRRLGILNPIIIDEAGVLIAGERRLTAAKSIGLTKVPVRRITDLSPIERHLVELEENIKRVDLSWQDTVQAVRDYHALRLEGDPTWTTNATAESIGLSPRWVYNIMLVAEEIEAGNEEITSADKLSKAVTIASTARDRRKVAAQAALKTELVKNTEKVNIAAEVPAPVAPDPVVSFFNEDFNKWARAYDGRPFTFIHCDFPYGIDHDKHDMGSASSFGGYDDSFSTYETLCNTLIQFATDHTTTDAHIMFWFSMEHYIWTYNFFTERGFKVQKFPLVWYKSLGILPDRLRGPRRNYETAFIITKGDPKIAEPVGNIIQSPSTKEFHTSEKPVPMLSHFFRMFVDEHTHMLDPTAGGGSALLAARQLGGEVVGLELDSKYYATTLANLRLKWDTINEK